MALTKISTGMLKQDAASSDLNIDAGTLYLDVSNNRVGIANTSPANTLSVSGSMDITGTIALENSTGYGLRDNRNNLFLTSSADTVISNRTLTLGNATYNQTILSGGNVGIGTTSPQEKLHLYTTGNSRVEAESTTGFAAFKATNNSGSYGWYVDNGADKFHLFDFTDGANRITVDGSGNVGIGTTSPETNLHIEDGSSYSLIRLVASTASVAGIDFGDADDRDIGRVRYNNSDDSMVFHTNAAEQMRIDSSGDLIVGGTSSGANDAVSISNTGYIQAIINGDTAAYFNRRTSDGEIVRLQKDGTRVGSIGVNSSRPYLVNSVDGGIHVGTDGYGRALLLPADQNGAPEDNLHYLGSSSYRWRDLYLSGKISTNSTTGLSITADSSNRGILNLSASTAYQLIGGTYYGYTGYKTGGYHRWFGSDGVEDMRLDSSGNLLVGKSSSAINTDGVELLNSGRMFLTTTSLSHVIRRKSTDGALVEFQKDGTTVGSISSTDNSGIIIGSNDVGLRFRQQSAGAAVFPREPDGSALDATLDLGISNSRFKDLYLSGATKLFSGTNSPVANSTLGDVDFGARTDGTVTARIRGIAGDNGNGTDGQLTFYTADNTVSQAAEERMRIDSSGTVYIGSTSDSGTNYHRLSDDGFVRHKRSGAIVAVFDRDSTDGEIILIRKDGTTVGSIGTSGGDLTIGTGDTGLTFEDAVDVIHPINQGTGAARDNAIDLGKSAARFKDLHLSGTANVGGVTVAGSLGNLSLNTSGAEIHLSRNGNNDILANGGTSADLTVGANRKLVFKTGSSLTEKARIDASGNLLVSKTSNDNSTAGVVLRDTGEGSFVASGQRSGLFNRLSSDGEIINFRKDGTTVGSIQSRAGLVSTIILDPRSGTLGTGITGSGSRLSPTDGSGAEVDARNDIGTSTYRFKDLHLSGTVNAATLNIDGGAVINESSADQDFRVESDGNSHALFVNAGNENVSIKSAGYTTTTDLNLLGAGLSIKNDKNGSSNNWSLIQNTAGGSQSNFEFITGAGSALTLNHDRSATFGSNVTSGGHLELNQTSSFANTGLTYHTNDWLYARGGVNGIILKNRASTIEMMRIKPTEVVVNDDGIADLDFRVESGGNANMLFVDGGNNRVMLGGSTQDGAGTLAFNSGSGVIRHVHPAGTAIDNILFAISGTNNGFQTTIDSSNNITYKFHTGGNTKAVEFGTTESVFNDNSVDRDFRVESNDRSHMFFVDAGSNKAEFSGQVNIFNGANTGNVGGISITPSQTQTTFLNNSPGAYGDYGQTFKTMRATGGSAYIRNFDMTYGGSVFNEDGIDIDFRVESDYTADAFFLDGQSGTINIGNGIIGRGITDNFTLNGKTQPHYGFNLDPTSSSAVGMSGYYGISFATSGAERFKIERVGGAVFNDTSADYDFRVESNDYSSIMYVNAGQNYVQFFGTGLSDAAVGHDFRSNGQATFVCNSTTRGLQLNNISTSDTQKTLLFQRNTVQRGSVEVGSSGVTYLTTSDRRLKKDIETITDGTDKLMAMNPVTHGWKADPEADAVHGFIAQEMMDIVPEAVAGDPESDEMMSMDYGRITPVIVAALQDAIKEIQELKTRINELEGK